jgi:hypothetical protein
VSDETEFFDKFAGDDRQIIDVEVEHSSILHGEGKQQTWVVVRYGDKTMVLDLAGLGDHLSVDVHSFIDGKDATAGVFGMSQGRRWELAGPPTTSHRFPSAHMVTVLLGEQA